MQIEVVQSEISNLHSAICNQSAPPPFKMVYASDFFVASSNKNKSVSIART